MHMVTNRWLETV